MQNSQAIEGPGLFSLKEEMVEPTKSCRNWRSAGGVLLDSHGAHRTILKELQEIQQHLHLLARSHKGFTSTQCCRDQNPLAGQALQSQPGMQFPLPLWQPWHRAALPSCRH